MAYGYWKAKLDKRESVFHLFFRKPPFKGGFTIAAGLESVIRFLQDYRFDASDLGYLESIEGVDGKPFFESAFLDYLGNLRFSADVDAVPEGTVVFPYEPLMRIQGPLLECQLLETSLLNLINFPTLIATKSARVCIAAQGDSVFEFGLRRAQGVDGALTASRSAYIGGCDATSNVLAGKMYGIPVRGTHSHSWVMVFDDELQAFETYAEYLPSNCVFLVDTYNTLAGVGKAIQAAKRLKERGGCFLGIRLDSGDLAYLSIQARKMMDEAGFPDAKIYASNELDETIISELKRQGAKITAWGVGTNLVTAKDQPALDGVYKLSAIRGEDDAWHYKLKLSEQMLKISNPGILQVRRFLRQGEYVADAIYDLKHPIQGDCKMVDLLDSTKETILKAGMKYEDLLQPIFRKGECVYALPSLDQIRNRTFAQLACFPTGIKRFLNPHLYAVGMEEAIYKEKLRLIKEIRELNRLGVMQE